MWIFIGADRVIKIILAAKLNEYFKIGIGVGCRIDYLEFFCQTINISMGRIIKTLGLKGESSKRIVSLYVPSTTFFDSLSDFRMIYDIYLGLELSTGNP